jgi:hypothetical protein
MSTPTPPAGDPDPAGGADPAPTLTRRGTKKLARIYLDASAPAAALEALSRLGSHPPHSETTILRAEALLGLGRAPEADALLGPVMIPLTPTTDAAPPCTMSRLSRAGPSTRRRAGCPAASTSS